MIKLIVAFQAAILAAQALAIPDASNNNNIDNGNSCHDASPQLKAIAVEVAIHSDSLTDYGHASSELKAAADSKAAANDIVRAEEEADEIVIVQLAGRDLGAPGGYPHELARRANDDATSASEEPSATHAATGTGTGTATAAWPTTSWEPYPSSTTSDAAAATTTVLVARQKRASILIRTKTRVATRSRSPRPTPTHHHAGSSTAVWGSTAADATWTVVTYPSTSVPTQTASAARLERRDQGSSTAAWGSTAADATWTLVTYPSATPTQTAAAGHIQNRAVGRKPHSSKTHSSKPTRTSKPTRMSKPTRTPRPTHRPTRTHSSKPKPTST
ncbi:hypothetical protein HK105_204721 [Polyrhizophydium stewartii]|uniref:Uncharacterized protein n=1 Tax=Polyrhizophydium stewartii TaxID=2732419 RepID=A0ABR4N8C9_9FUNG